MSDTASSKLFPRNSRSSLATAAAGDGPFIIDAQGRRYLDACSGAAVSCLGHSNHRVLAAVKEQLDRLAWAHNSFFTSEPAEALARRLIDIAPAGIDRVYFVSGGSEAVESALKLARQYFVEQQQPQRRHVIARWQSYHGNTLGALSAGGNRWRRDQFEPLLSSAMHHIAACHYWRFAEENETEQEYALRMANQLESKILELGADSVAAFIAEPVVGATLGAVAASEGYFKRIREICDQYGVLLILDEVMCGMGRTGSMFASEQEGIAPDIVCIAKGLGAGVQPIGAMLCSKSIYAAIEQGSGFFQHGHTYLAHAAACAAGLAVLDEISDRGLIQQVKLRGESLQGALQSTLGQHPHVGDIRGRGLFIGIELVADRSSKAPFDPQLTLAAKIKKQALDAGLMVYTMSGSVDGRTGDHILLAPPFIIDDANIGFIAETLEQVISSSCS